MSFCKSLTTFRPERQLCEMARQRFGATREAIQAAGGVRHYAVDKADEEYRAALAAPEWHAPRTTAGTWSKQLQDMNVVIPDQFVSDTLVNTVRRVQPGIWGGHAVRALATHLLDPVQGLGIQAVDHGMRELLPDDVVASKQALCGEWGYLLSGALMVLGQRGTAVLSKQTDGQYHVEAYAQIGANRYWHLPWSLTGEKRSEDGEVVSRLPQEGVLNRADLTMVYAINSVLSSEASMQQQRHQLQQLAQWHSGPAIQAWLNEAIAKL